MRLGALLASALILAAGAEERPLPCPPGDKDCARKVLRTHPAKQLALWEAALARPVAERIGAAPPELVEILALDNIANGFPNQPRRSAPDAAFLADVQRAFAGIPEVVKRLLATKLAGIHFVDDIGGTGFTDSIRDAGGKPVAGFIVLDPTVLAPHTANGWATWKDSTPFKLDARHRLEARIEARAHDDRAHAIQYILLHEIAHVLSIGGNVHPDWNLDPDQVGSTRGLDFFNLSWAIAGKAYASVFDAAFPERKDVVFYFGPRLEAKLMIAVYAALERTSFPTLYAATHPADDFAEAFANYVHVVLMKRPFEIRLLRDGAVAKSYRACWNEPRCARKRVYLERYLR